MFTPPRCPHRHCPNHVRPRSRFFTAHGSYRSLCRAHPIPRFRCKACRRTFSRQTFRMDYRDHRPDLNARLFQSLASGLGLRQSSRNLRLSLRCTELKFRKIARHLRRLNLNLRENLTGKACFQLDEIETYEGRRNSRPLSVPLLIETKSRFVIWAEAASIRARGKMTSARRAKLVEEEKRLGRRRDHSRASLRRTLRRGAALARGLEEILFQTDRKSAYPALLRQAFGRERVVHSQTSSRLARTVSNPLFPINQTEALARDLTGRLRRESWLGSKKRRYLDLGLQIFLAYRNYVRKRFNFDRASPAVMLGFAPRRLEESELLSWRQDWGRRSVHPLARGNESVADRLERGVLVH